MADVIARGLAKKAQSDLATVNSQLANKANQTDLENVSSQLAQNANQIIEERTNIFSRKSIASIKKAIVFIDDDGRSETYTRLRPIANAAGVKFTSCLLTGSVGTNPDYMTWEQVKQLSDDGHDIQSHTHNHHDISTLPIEELEYQLRTSKEILNQKGYKAEHLIYPGGSYSLDSIDTVRKYYKSGIAINSGINSIPIENYIVTRYNLDTASLDTLKGYADTLNSKESGLLVFMMHTFNENWTTTKEQELSDFFTYIASLSIPVLTWTAAFEHFGNIIEVGSKAKGQYFKVDPYGNISNQIYDNISAKRYSRNSLSFSTLPSYFAGNDISITDFNGSATDTGFPERKEGTLITYSGNDTKWQYWYPYNSYNHYVRKNTNSTTWSAFKLANQPYLSQVIDFGSIPAYSTKDIEITLTGVTFGKSLVIANPSGPLPAGLIINATIKSGNIVVVRIANVTANPITAPPTMSYKFTWFDLF